MVGLPLHLSGEEGSQAALARSFCVELEAMLKIPVETYDERLTTRMADARGAPAPRRRATRSPPPTCCRPTSPARPRSRSAPMTDEWMRDDPFANPDDPAAREREQRRLEREERRRQREAKQGKKRAAAPPPEPAATAESAPPRTPEQEFWDEPADPVTPDTAGPQAEAAPVGVTPEAPVAAETDAAEGLEKARPGDPGSPPDAPPPDEGLSPARTRDPGAGRGRGSGGGSVLGRARRHPLLIVGILLALIVVWFLFALFQPFHGDGSGRVAVTVPKGASVSEVGDLLGDKGVVDSSTLFQIRATLEGKRSELYPGHYTLAEGMSYGAALEALSKPPVKRVTTVTIPEGYSRSQAAQLVEEDGLAGDYTRETVRSKFLSPAKYGGKGAKNLEGFLFPDTFEMKPGRRPPTSSSCSCRTSSGGSGGSTCAMPSRRT